MKFFTRKENINAGKALKCLYLIFFDWRTPGRPQIKKAKELAEAHQELYEKLYHITVALPSGETHLLADLCRVISRYKKPLDKAATDTDPKRIKILLNGKPVTVFNLDPSDVCRALAEFLNKLNMKTGEAQNANQ